MQDGYGWNLKDKQNNKNESIKNKGISVVKKLAALREERGGLCGLCRYRGTNMMKPGRLNEKMALGKESGFLPTSASVLFWLDYV